MWRKFFKWFRGAHGIVSKAVCSESASVDTNVTNKYKETTLLNLLKDYSPCIVYNVKESDLFL
ncbi:hypothetical protein KUTeg_024642 [Tegillarca granosa]|uniref:Uncharacterized protein n=1 Tax=Tegillarca granosa TaxID=220873 RepID=A0ABQ9E0Y8_TEGGR|nr:hypothetical protein KUTeg_024642 [Tegillarca granosa]